jgi:RNA polymerase sigma-70 factor (ECF subfamily)
MKEISFRTDVLPLKDELFRLALRITLNRADAEDAVQETMLKVWNRRDRWAELESIEAFCLTICRNLALDKLKRADNQNTSLGDEEGGGEEPADRSYAANPEEQAVQRDRVEQVRRLISQLPEKQRTCMQLRDIEGKAYKEIASVLAITEQQVKVNIFRARQTIKEKFQQLEQHGL